THQARRFFSHCRRIERKLRPDPSAWARVRPDVLFLDEAAADAVGKREKKIPDLFHDFIRQNVAAIKTPADFLDGFLRHFEALIAFGSLHLKERSVQRCRNCTTIVFQAQSLSSPAPVL